MRQQQVEILAASLAEAAHNLEEAHAHRDWMIRRAHQVGMSMREIARHAGMTHPGVKKIIER